MTQILSKGIKERKQENTIEDVAPDGGWGWIVCIGTFFANFISDGTMFSSGVQILAFLDYFQETKSATSWVSSTQLGLSMMMGPVVSYFIARYSVRSVTIAGGIIAFLGALAGAFSPNLAVLILTYGVICGIGICLFFISSIVAVGLYFTKKRAIATGIATSGSGLGVIVYPYLTETLLSVYDWRNTLLIIAALCLNAAVCGAVFRPLAKSFTRKSSCKCIEEHSIEEEANEKESMIKNKTLQGIELNQNKLYNSASNIHKSHLTVVEKIKFNDHRQYHSAHNIQEAVGKPHKSESHNFLSPNLRSDVFYSGSITNLPTSHTDMQCIEKDISTEDLSSMLETGVCDSNKRVLFSCFLVCRQPAFLLLLICMILWTAQAITMTYLPDMAVSKGLPRNQAAMLISIIGVTNTVVRIVAGFIVDVFRIKSLYLYIVALCLGAVANISLPWCDSFSLLAACAVGFGLCMGTSVCLRTILIADTLGIDQLTQAFGIIAFFQGIAFTLNPPLAGLLYDVSNSYVYPFLLAGLYYVVAVMMCIILICVSRNVQQQKTFIVKVDDEDFAIN